MISLWSKQLYRSPIDFLIDIPIREYDITKANISVLRDANIISEDQYQYFLNCSKIERSIAIGKMQGQNSKVTDILKEGIKNAKKIFMKQNNIQDAEVLSIRNDSITVIGLKEIANCQITDRVKFRLAGSYSSFYHINTIDLFYLYDRITGAETLDIKGLGESGIELHKPYMMDLMMALFYSAQIESIKSAISLLSEMHNTYINRRFDVNYYREFNPQSKFCLKENFSQFSTFYMDYATNRDKDILDISYNEQVLRNFMRILATVYFGKK